MTRRQVIKTASGEELVVVSRADFDALVAAAADAEEDATDVAAYDDAMRELAAEEQRTLPPVENATILIQHGFIRSARKQLD